MEKSYTKEMKIIKIDPPKKVDVITIRLLISLAAILMIAFVAWFFRTEHVGFTPLFIFLTLALLFKLVKMIHEWYHYWSVSIPVMPESTRKWKVDMLTTSCPGEPREMIIRTLKKMVAVT